MTLWIAIAIAGCGGGAKSDGGGGSGGSIGGSGPYLPLAVGSRWTYQVTDADGKTSVKVQSVAAAEPVGGVGPHSATMAFRLTSGNKVDDPEGDRSWQGIVEGRVVRYREQSVDGKSGKVKNEQYWDPPRLRLDEGETRVAAEASWAEPPYTEFNIDIDTLPDGGTDSDGGTSYVPDGGMTSRPDIHDAWSVVSPSQTITVPAGRFDTLVVRRVGDGGDSIKTFWFARGVGKVREAEEGQPTEELISYQLAP